ncbi:MAG: 50S ribosomal protein L18 [Spirochaetaceae bacterium]|nr:MAG: 50S ribosomal protein L18 [Spirochaetaceae bacterium]
MKRLKIKTKQKLRRRARVRGKISGTATRPRVSVFKSNKHLYVQVIDDISGHTLTQVSTMGGETKGLKVTVSDGEKVGKSLGEKMKAAGIAEVVYDRNGNRYHGVVKAIAEGVRSVGIKV